MKKRQATEHLAYDIRNCTFGYKCSLDWHSLPDLSKSKTGSVVKHCSECNKNVYQANTDQELIEHIKLNHCIAILNKDGMMDLGYMTSGLELFESD
jgi:hypothetical protein